MDDAKHFALITTTGKLLQPQDNPRLHYSHQENGDCVHVVVIRDMMDLNALCEKFNCDLIYSVQQNRIELIDGYRE